MRYLGGKAKISKHLCKYLNSSIEPGQNFYDLFCGAGNIVSKIDCPNKYANDIRKFMISALEAARDGYEFPSVVTREDYKSARLLPETDPLHGFILVGCSFAGKYKGGYATKNPDRDYVNSAIVSLTRKSPGFKNVQFTALDYREVNILPNSVIYCDIPYHGTIGYGQNFNHYEFYQWVSEQKHTIYISEYKDSYNPLNLPSVWELEHKQHIRNKDGHSKKTIEILRKFTPPIYLNGIKIHSDSTNSDRKYQIIYADPPWEYKDKANAGNRGAMHKYNLMSLDDICKLPINELADDDCFLFLWVTFPQLPKAFKVIESWGFNYKSIGFNWVKMNKKQTDTLFFGLGHYTRANSEICLLATKGKPKRISAKVHSVVQSPIRKHSQKPDEVRDRILDLCGDVPRLELFARDRVRGWDAMGDEL